MQTRSILATLAAAAVAITALAGLARAAEPPAVTVQLFQFRPGQLEVPKGTRLTVTNQDDIAHTMTSGTPERRDGRFRAALAGKGATAAIELVESGVHPYFCERHTSMRGEIRVP